MKPPSDFTLQIVTALDQAPQKVTVICLDVDALGSFKAAKAWAVEHQQDNLFLAVGQTGGDMTPLSEHTRGIFTPPEDPNGWREAAYLLWFAIEHPEFQDPPSSEPGAVSLEEFEEHLRAHISGESDDGVTC